jgi:hypothetical protein
MKKALARLRAKTDRELGILAEQQLEQTLRLARIGKKEEAVRGYESAKRLLEVTNLNCVQRDRIDASLAQVEVALEVDRPITAVA